MSRTNSVFSMRVYFSTLFARLTRAVYGLCLLGKQSVVWICLVICTELAKIEEVVKRKTKLAPGPVEICEAKSDFTVKPHYNEYNEHNAEVMIDVLRPRLGTW